MERIIVAALFVYEAISAANVRRAFVRVNLDGAIGSSQARLRDVFVLPVTAAS
jgi:hypothetical protein